MHFAVMRAEKVRNIGVLANLLKHATRELPPENADPAKKELNRTLVGRETAAGVLGDFRALWPKKRRKDAVLCVEYMMSASPAWWDQASDQQKTDFVHKSVSWLESKYGPENLVYVGLHRDEVTPHLTVFVAPLKDGKLNASQYIGNRSQMAFDQTTYAECLRELGIVRGIEKSQATHVTPSAFYAQLKAAEKAAKSSVDQYLERAELPEPKVTDLARIGAFVKKVAKAAADPLMKLLKAQQLKIAQLEERVADREATLDEHRRLYSAFFRAIDAIPSPAAKKRALEAIGAVAGQELTAELREEEVRQEAEDRLEQQIEYVAERLFEADLASSPLRGRVLAEGMVSGQDPEFAKWLNTPAPSSATAPKDAVSPAAPSKGRHRGEDSELER